MSIARGIQSAIFFYLSCAPCVGMATQRRMKREARRDRIEKAALQLDSPDAYRHPDPSSTNPHWNEEIALGPGPPPRGKKRNKRNIGTAGTQGSARSRVNSDFDGDGVAGIEMSVSPGTSHTSLDGRWDTRRDEREDDDTWGVETISSRGGIRLSSSAGSATGLVPLSRPSTGRSASDSYYTPRPPPVNEYHPPVRKGYERKEGDSSQQQKWKSREQSRRRSRGSAYVRDSKSTHGSPKTTLSPSRSAKKSSHERRSVAEDSDASDDSLQRDKRHDSGNHLAIISPNVERGSPKNNKAVRQRLSTVHSGETLVKRPNTVRASTQMDLKTSVLHKENISELPVRSKTTRAIKKPEPLVIRDSSLNLLQELVSPNALLNSQFVKSPTLEARIQLPPTNSTEELQLRSLSPWFPSDDFIVAADDSGSDYATNSRLRWSMDI
ncbi:hypothetical protein SLS58_006891 [Diplodia intermedia]|uniref:Signal peptide-containing protein n=1 Tax=Diplodia intermedia TaxID=856260 RepID=A0ABR3TMD2_9PEZI